MDDPRIIGADTETHDGVPYSAQISIADGTAIMVLLFDIEAVKELKAQLLKLLNGGWRLVFHYAPADLPIFESIIGFELSGRYEDTMLAGYGFGNLGRLGLKALARRILGRSRLSWEETVTPYSKEVLAQWMMKAFVYSENTWHQEISRFHKKSGKPLKPMTVLSEPEKLLPELLRYCVNNPDYPIWQKLFERMPREWMERLVEACGPVPVKGIAHCPLNVQIEYACSDPDDTRRLWLKMQAMREEFERGLCFQGEDRDT